MEDTLEDAMLVSPSLAICEECNEFKKRKQESNETEALRNKIMAFLRSCSGDETTWEYPEVDEVWEFCSLGGSDLGNDGSGAGRQKNR